LITRHDIEKRWIVIKKVVLWVVYAVFVGLLVFGAVNRSEAKAGTGSGEGKAVSENISCEANEWHEISKRRQSENRDSRPGSAGEKDQKTITGEGDHEWNTYEGIVHSISEDSLMIDSINGEDLIIEGRAWKYALEHGFITDTGNSIQLSGFFEEGEFKVSWIIDIDTESFVEVRDPSGHPLWAGGRGSGK
jgi:hypothetical protein